MKRVLVLATLASVVALLLFSSGASASPDIFTIIQLTTNSAQDAGAQVSGDRLV